jgi:predicted CXXCH cytochrome family protein
MSRPPLVLSLLLFTFATALTPAQKSSTSNASASPGASLYVGSDACQGCHDDMDKTVAESAHQKLLEGKEPSPPGCESCHGPGATHVDGNGDTSKILRFQGAPAEVVRARCETCHQSLIEEDGGHRQLSCLSCHSVHHYRQKKFILTTAQDQLCLHCHQELPHLDLFGDAPPTGSRTANRDMFPLRHTTRGSRAFV